MGSKTVWILALLVVCLAFAAPLQAQPRHQPGRYGLDVREVALDEALKRLIQEAEISLVYEPALVAGRRATCVAEEETAEGLLQCILRKTGLTYRQLPSGTYVLSAEGTPGGLQDDPRPAPVASGSAALSGRVVDAETGKTLPAANLFLAHTMRGTTTRGDGSYEIGQIPPSVYEVVASMVGYQRSVHEVELEPGEHRRLDFALEPVVYEVEGVEVVGRRTRAWKKNLRQFEKLFLGTSSNADETKILNPYVLDFQTSWSRMLRRATASAPLDIENRALGYRITFVLSDFSWDPQERRVRYSGQPHFEELAPEDEQEARKWIRNREAAYAGSLQHLLLSMIEGRTQEEGFWLRTEKFNRWMPVEVEDVLQEMPWTDRCVLSFKHTLAVTHQKEKKERGFFAFLSGAEERTSYLSMTEPGATVYPDGYTPSAALLMYGDMGWRRIADLLPREYGIERLRRSIRHEKEQERMPTSAQE